MELDSPFSCSVLQAMCSLERLQRQLGSEPRRKYSNQVIGYFELKYMLVIESVRAADVSEKPASEGAGLELCGAGAGQGVATVNLCGGPACFRKRTSSPLPADLPDDTVSVIGSGNYLISFSSPLDDSRVVLDV